MHQPKHKTSQVLLIICATSMAWSYVAQPILIYILSLFNIHGMAVASNVSDMVSLLSGLMNCFKSKN